ncbi:DUF2398 family protein [Actinomadura sp. 7K507]|uniref:DUF2398 family protein n=1 Tax=Actinomadura sp. 7K507 TaxID=2530365 RepID=UPI00104DEC65|nr:DUF2398 family protein [Actinomadura sp. 7K507]TDC87045.1 DUF2398 family protein [Actinomadura sp. 7K507]
MTGRRLDPDLSPAARILNATGRLRAEFHPEEYRTALKGRERLTAFFHDELGWTLEVSETASLIRLHKRRADVPSDRGPRLQRARGDGPLASKKVLICCALICEQLWRRSRMSLQELLQAIAQTCATEEDERTLPPFPVVLAEDVSKQQARSNRLCLVDALKLLVAEGTATVDDDLDRVVDDEEANLVVTASRERLATKFSSLSPLLLGLASLPPEQHAAALSRATLSDSAESDVPSLDERRVRLMRRIADDPATDPVDDPTEGSPYLHTPAGRERALDLITSFGYIATVRRDWWEVTDRDGTGTGIEFPHGRRTERQASLALLAAIVRRTDPAAPLSTAEAVEVLELARRDRPRWAAAYAGRLPVLARVAAAELTNVGLLRPDPHRGGTWLSTPGARLWHVKVHSPPVPAAARTDAGSAVQPSLLTDED